jgi:hypothetical protein
LGRQEVDPQFVVVDVVRRKTRSAGHPARAVGSVLAVSLCLAWGLLLATSGAALGLSGFASPTSSVSAQYPDSGASSGRPPVISSLGSIIHRTDELGRGPRQQASERQIAVEASGAVVSTASLDTRQYGLVALLIIAIGILLLGGLLHWRRGRVQT